jgi:hypothetical protein
MEKYCHMCGDELEKFYTGTFNIETGEKNYKLVCPKKLCSHTGHIWDSNYERKKHIKPKSSNFDA